MIGVLVPVDDVDIAAEFFQLFKTPWEPYVAGRNYDVVITTLAFIPPIRTRLLIASGSDACSLDATLGARIAQRRQTAVVQTNKMRFPVYDGIRTFEQTSDSPACRLSDGAVAGFWKHTAEHTILRLGYNVFREARHLLSSGQPLDHALVPTLEFHIEALRKWMLEARLSFAEIPPTPAGTSFIVCLTHDIDFFGIRRHWFDHTFWGFLFRTTFGATQRFVQGRIDLRRLIRCWAAFASLPLVYLGWKRDYWLPFEWYLKVEEDLGATYYLIPFKHRMGERVSAKHPSRRAVSYDVSELTDWMQRLEAVGCEIGVHGIDAWHNAAKGKEERDRISSISGKAKVGIRIHWLLTDGNTFRALEEAGYDYDATVGYNETPGYRAGTNQVYRPIGVERLLELPLLVQDGALFYPGHLDLSESEAWALCASLIRKARNIGGVVTVLWHDRSHGPERFWGDFYRRLLDELRVSNPWFATASQAVDWFRARRCVVFERVADQESLFARCQGSVPSHPFLLRIHRPASRLSEPSSASKLDVSWSGQDPIDLSTLAEDQSDEGLVPSLGTNRN